MGGAEVYCYFSLRQHYLHQVCRVYSQPCGTPKVYTKLYKNPKRKFNYLFKKSDSSESEKPKDNIALLLLLLLLLPHFHVSAIRVSIGVRLSDDAGTEYSGCFFERSVPILI